jgi:hypothetical protein
MQTANSTATATTSASGTNRPIMSRLLMCVMRIRILALVCGSLGRRGGTLRTYFYCGWWETKRHETSQGSSGQVVGPSLDEAALQ